VIDGNTRIVSPFEANLITITRHLMHQPVPGDARVMIREKMPRPQVLSENAIHLLKDTLSKGCVLFLVRQGGWRNERFLQEGKPLEGRVWDRHPVGERLLSFQRCVLEFLVWLTSDRPHKPEETWRPSERSPADELFFAMAISRLLDIPDAALLMRDKTAFAGNGLARLACPDLFAAPNDFPSVEFAPWFEPPRVSWLEALQPWLAKLWIDFEFDHGQTEDWNRLADLGRSKGQTLTAFIAAARSAQRPDLCRFLLTAMDRVFGNGPRPLSFWIGGLNDRSPIRLADRLNVQRAAVSVPQAFLTYSDWMANFRTIGYFDDAYAVAQIALADWEAINGEQLAAAARQSVSAIEPLKT
jgi:hypothetical protein